MLVPLPVSVYMYMIVVPKSAEIAILSLVTTFNLLTCIMFADLILYDIMYDIKIKSVFCDGLICTTVRTYMY